MKKTITREYLANCIKEELGFSRSESLKLVSLILNNLSNSIKKDKVLKLPNLGTFKIRKKNSRIGRNPKTGEESVITARSVISFNASEKLKSRLNLK
ncbi:MAG: integration host factor subunit alpha [Pelagibacterales bacterium]|nr:integration host factor subunit alpha [Pelagibacterales bacterium]PPR14897.1 MAG: Integration host factor subunit alpha [Alphaproteobacteria bacterium MarineAlpha9_Bin3]|tara:strand:+ start:1272 stop:1562 length:291 start_codon:yes stop_codon:yes gene_type:complete